VLALESATVTALSICAIHAAYKSALFVSTGKILVSTSTYVDSISPSLSSGKSLVVIPVLFLVGLGGTSYASAKHGIDLVGWSSSTSQFIVGIVVGFGFLVVWILGIRSTSNLKTVPSANTTDFLP
jgi:hypothetical protein